MRIETADSLIPIPPRKSLGRTPVVQAAVFTALAGMEVGAPPISFERAQRQIERYVKLFRATYGEELQFTVRELRPGWSRVWRVA